MFQQLLANKHPRLRDSVPIVIWPRGGLGLVTDKKTKKKKKKNSVQSKNRARPMAARLTRRVCSMIAKMTVNLAVGALILDGKSLNALLFQTKFTFVCLGSFAIIWRVECLGMKTGF